MKIDKRSGNWMTYGKADEQLTDFANVLRFKKNRSKNRATSKELFRNGNSLNRFYEQMTYDVWYIEHRTHNLLLRWKEMTLLWFASVLSLDNPLRTNSISFADDSRLLTPESHSSKSSCSKYAKHCQFQLFEIISFAKRTYVRFLQILWGFEIGDRRSIGFGFILISCPYLWLIHLNWITK